MKPEHRRVLIEAHVEVKRQVQKKDINIDTALFKDIPLESGIDNHTQERILELQRAKQRVMLWLKQQLQMIDRSETIRPFESASKKFHVRYQEGKLLARTEEEKDIEITLGELLTDGIWSVGYELDSSSVPREVAKQYVSALAKMHLQELLDKQLVLHELAVNKNGNERKSFSAISGRQREGKEKLFQDQGFIAESMIFNLLKKCVIDHKLPITIKEADAFDDVVNKIDFVISRRDHQQGVDLQIKEGQEQSIGVQFTLMHRKDAMEGKRQTVLEALRRGISSELLVSDIAIVNIHPSYIKRAINAWKSERLPGGPDSKLETPAQVDILQKILAPLFSEEEIDQIIKQIFNVDRHQLRYLKTY